MYLNQTSKYFDNYCFVKYIDIDKTKTIIINLIYRKFSDIVITNENKSIVSNINKITYNFNMQQK